MPQDKRSVVEVKNLKIGVLAENAASDKKYRFTIDYGSFTVNEGDFLLVKGRNGYGKTTFLKDITLYIPRFFRLLEVLILRDFSSFREGSPLSDSLFSSDLK